MFDEIIKYFSKVYFPAVGKKVIPVIIYSAICQKWQKLEKKNRFRYRLNLMLQRESGYFKSSILEQVASFFPFKANMLTTGTAAAIRGSFNDGKFFPPELLISDVLIFPEFTAILNADKDVQGQILSAAEEANIRIALVKAGKMTPKTIEDIESYGAKVVDKRLVYRNKATLWTATHTIDSLSEFNRDALLSRFFMVQIQHTEIPKDLWLNDPRKHINVPFEKEIAEWFDEIYLKSSKPDHKFCESVIVLLGNGYVSEDEPKPREGNDIRRMILAHHDMFPDEDYNTVAHVMKKHLDNQVAKTSREIIIDLIFHKPRTVAKIMEITGLKKSNIFNHLKRNSALSTGSNPRKYYMDYIPKFNTHGGPRIGSNNPNWVGKKASRPITVVKKTKKKTKKITKKKSTKKSKKKSKKSSKKSKSAK